MEVWEYVVIAIVITVFAVHEAKRARFDFLLISWWRIARDNHHFGGVDFLIHYLGLLTKWVAISLFFSVFILIPVFGLLVKATGFNALFIGIIVSVLFYYLLLKHMRDSEENQPIKDFFSPMPTDPVKFVTQLIKLVLAIVPDIMRKFFQPLINADESIVDGCVSQLCADYADHKSDIIQSFYRYFPHNPTDDEQTLKEQVDGLNNRGEIQQLRQILTEKIRRLGYVFAKVEIDRLLTILNEDQRSAARQPVKGQAIEFDYQGKSYSGSIVECSSNGRGCYITTQANIPPGISIFFDCHGETIEAKVMHCMPSAAQAIGMGVRVENGVNLAPMLMA